jgi:hypothetical protein
MRIGCGMRRWGLRRRECLEYLFEIIGKIRHILVAIPWFERHRALDNGIEPVAYLRM